MDTLPPVVAEQQAPAFAERTRMVSGREPIRIVAAIVVLAVALFVLPASLDSYWLQIMTAVAMIRPAAVTGA